jgi:hypothetical protein
MNSMTPACWMISQLLATKQVTGEGEDDRKIQVKVITCCFGLMNVAGF